jgi:hypothetical protein
MRREAGETETSEVWQVQRGMSELSLHFQHILLITDSISDISYL